MKFENAIAVCPFCGEDGKIMPEEDGKASYWVECSSPYCGIMGQWARSPDAAVKFWNRRANSLSKRESERISEIIKRHEKAGKGPWKVSKRGNAFDVLGKESDVCNYVPSASIARFIASSITDIPFLVNILKRLFNAPSQGACHENQDMERSASFNAE